MVHLKWPILLLGVVIYPLLGFAFCFGETDAPQETGTLEIECNIAGIHLALCPKAQFHTKKEDVLFGLFSKSRHVCSKGRLSLGITPITPVSLAPGTYILLIPQNYFWEGEDPYPVVIQEGKKTYRLLKLLTHEGDHGGSGGGGGGAAR